MILIANKKEVLLDDDIGRDLIDKTLNLDGHGYVFFKENRKIYWVHRWILSATGKERVDHKNGNIYDNRKENLRICTSSENNINRPPKKGYRYKGVCRVSTKRKDGMPLKNKWMAKITKDYRQIYIGIFKNEKDAALAYNEKAIELFGEFAYLNKI